MKYVNKRMRYVESVDDMNYILSMAHKFTVLFNCDYDSAVIATGKYGGLRNNSFIRNGEKYIELTTRYVTYDEKAKRYIYHDNFPCTWRFDKTGDDIHHISPASAIRVMNNIYTPFDVVNETSIFHKIDGKVLPSASPLISYNSKFDKTEHECWCYDLNSAYAAVLVDKIIDTYHFDTNRRVRAGEVGFMLDDKLTMVHEGRFAEYVFKLIPSPFKTYCETWYRIKSTYPKGSAEKDEAKQRLVIPIGCWQNHNPFLRAYVVNTCNERIQQIVNQYKDHVCMWNTDAVYSDVPLDLPCGNAIGQFKVEHYPIFRQIGDNYQKFDESGVKATVQRGVPKYKTKSEDYNILTDKVPQTLLAKYEYNARTYKIYETEGVEKNG